MSVKVKGQPIEAKPATGLSTNFVIGYIIAIVFALWPTLSSKIPVDLQAQLPVVIGTVLGAAVAYFTPHTNRPELQSVTPFSEAELEAIRKIIAQPVVVVSGPGGGGTSTVTPRATGGGTSSGGPGGKNSWD